MGKSLLFVSSGSAAGEVNLLDPHAVMVDGWKVKRPELKGGGIYSSSALADGRELVIEAYDNVIEEMPLFINGKDPDQIGAVQSVLDRLLNKLRGFFVRAERETTPVYLGFRPKDQTNIQYALLKNYSLSPDTESFGHSLKGSLFKSATLAGTLFLEREPGWRDYPPGVLPALQNLTQPDAPAASTYPWIPNYRSNYSLTHIFNFDDSAGTYSANLIATPAFAYFPAAPAVQDTVYFISTQGPFFNVLPYIGTAGNTNVTYTWEYWSGAWTTATVYTADLGVSGQRFRTGVLPIRWNGATDWTRTVVNGVNGFALRLRISAFTSWTTSPANATQVVYTAKNPYFTLPAGVAKGDLPAFVRMLLTSGGGALAGGFYLIAAGAKSRGLANFTSRLNAGSSNQNPTGWSMSYSTDTIGSQDGSSPTGDRAGCNFSSSTSLGSRVTWRLTDANRTSDWVGLYQAYLVAQQVGGSAGDCTVQLSLQGGATGYSRSVWNSSIVKLQRVSAGKELVNLGRIRIPASGDIDAGMTGLGQILQLSIAASGSVGRTLFFYELVLLPVDEGALVLKDDFNLTALERIDADSGVIRDRAEHEIITDVNQTGDWNALHYVSIGTFQKHSQVPAPNPDEDTAYFFLFGDAVSTPISGSMILSVGNGLHVSMQLHNRWSGLRGSI